MKTIRTSKDGIRIYRPMSLWFYDIFQRSEGDMVPPCFFERRAENGDVIVRLEIQQSRGLKFARLTSREFGSRDENQALHIASYKPLMSAHGNSASKVRNA